MKIISNHKTLVMDDETPTLDMVDLRLDEAGWHPLTERDHVWIERLRYNAVHKTLGLRVIDRVIYRQVEPIPLRLRVASKEPFLVATIKMSDRLWAVTAARSFEATKCEARDVDRFKRQRSRSSGAALPPLPVDPDA